MHTMPKVLLTLGAATITAACQRDLPAAAPPPGATPSGLAVTAPQAADDPARPLTAAECDTLGQYIADQCRNRVTVRSAQVDAWCSDMVHGAEGGTWAAGDCAKHVRYMDEVCFRSTTSVERLMDCDKAVDRP